MSKPGLTTFDSRFHLCIFASGRQWLSLLSLPRLSLCSHADKQNADLTQASLTAPFVFVLIVAGGYQADIYPFFMNRALHVYPTKEIEGKKKKNQFPNGKLMRRNNNNLQDL